MSLEIKFDDDVLCCPCCGFNYLHHGEVTVYSRGEDAPQEIKTVVHGNGSASTIIVESEGSGNPSSRRDGLVIKFSCEGCPAKLELTISQHKGNTHFDWRLDAPRRERRYRPPVPVYREPKRPATEAQLAAIFSSFPRPPETVK